jgi:hypothetical protein
MLSFTWLYVTVLARDNLEISSGNKTHAAQILTPTWHLPNIMSPKVLPPWLSLLCTCDMYHSFCEQLLQFLLRLFLLTFFSMNKNWHSDYNFVNKIVKTKMFNKWTVALLSWSISRHNFLVPNESTHNIYQEISPIFDIILQKYVYYNISFFKLCMQIRHKRRICSSCTKSSRQQTKVHSMH